MSNNSEKYERVPGPSSSSSSLSVTVSVVNLVLSIIIGTILIATLAVSIYTASKSSNKKDDVIPEFPAIDSRYALPSKYAVDYSVPRLLQLNRGTCWAFGTIGALEHSYRLNGIAKGFLQAEEYVPFSLQAYGIRVVNECTNASDICEVLGDQVYVYPDDSLGNTEGGEVSYLYYLKNLWKQIYPETLCKYEGEHDNWKKCDNLTNIDFDKNPIRFNINHMHTTYDVEDTKQLIYQQKQTLVISTPVHGNYFYIPCYDPDVRPTSPLCKEYSDEQKVLCPPWVHIAYENANGSSVKCIKQEGPGYNMDGEWYIDPHVKYAAEGGHAMQIVGYNDHYRSFYDDVGGFLIKNSWVDQSYLFNLSNGLGRGGRGSHSIDYLQMKISDWDEKQICPNADSPLNWLSCTEVETGPTGANDHARPSREGNTRRLTVNSRVRNHIRKKYSEYLKPQSGVRSNQGNPASQCLNETWRMHFVNLTKQPMQFKCRIEEGSNGTERFGCTPGYHYYLDWLEFDENGLVDANFIEVQTDNETFNASFTLYSLPLSQLAEAFLPDETYRSDPDFYKNNLLNSIDECGYYFFPYSLLEKAARKSSSWFATHFNIDWEPSSYLSQRDSYSGLDYTYLESGVKKQTKHTYGGPEPYTEDATNPAHPEPDWPTPYNRASTSKRVKVSKKRDL